MNALCEMSEHFPVINRAAFMQRATLVNGDWSLNALKLGIDHQHRETGLQEQPGGLYTDFSYCPVVNAYNHKSQTIACMIYPRDHFEV